MLDKFKSSLSKGKGKQAVSPQRKLKVERVKKKKERPPPPKSVDELKGCCNRMKNNKIRHCIIVPTFRCAVIFYSVIFAILFLFGILIIMTSLINKNVSF